MIAFALIFSSACFAGNVGSFGVLSSLSMSVSSELLIKSSQTSSCKYSSVWKVKLDYSQLAIAIKLAIWL